MNAVEKALLQESELNFSSFQQIESTSSVPELSLIKTKVKPLSFFRSPYPISLQEGEMEGTEKGKEHGFWRGFLAGKYSGEYSGTLKGEYKGGNEIQEIDSHTPLSLLAGLGNERIVIRTRDERHIMKYLLKQFPDFNLIKDELKDASIRLALQNSNLFYSQILPELDTPIEKRAEIEVYGILLKKQLPIIELTGFSYKEKPTPLKTYNTLKLLGNLAYTVQELENNKPLKTLDLKNTGQLLLEQKA